MLWQFFIIHMENSDWGTSHDLLPILTLIILFDSFVEQFNWDVLHNFTTIYPKLARYEMWILRKDGKGYN